ncbi:MAG: hypothetical protein BWY00_01637 [Firmicutes bacterium ADurb.Bin153]|nr:MAG: hypothetical protein BWY00_01637 [Firmicutes bacterium ADurb.Bin153]
MSGSSERAQTLSSPASWSKFVGVTVRTRFFTFSGCSAAYMTLIVPPWQMAMMLSWSRPCFSRMKSTASAM